MTGLLTIPFTGLRKQYNNLRQEILDVTDEVLRSGQLMNGNFTAEFENWLARRNQVSYAVTVHSGTSALECIAEYYVKQVGMPNPPCVLMPSMTYAATANAFMRAGWDIHLIDVDASGILDPKKIPDTSYQAVVLVGLYGAAVTHWEHDHRWRDWKLHETVVIEDAAQHWLSDHCVRIGRAAAISFDPMKNLPCYGNGGAVVTNDIDLMHFARAWRDAGKPGHYATGTNSRMSEIDCAHLMVKTRHLDAWQTRRAKISEYWIKQLEKTGVRTLITDANRQDHAHHKFVIDVDDRDELKKNLAIRKIETRVHYTQPLHEIGVYRQWPGPDLLSCASALGRRVLSLPIYPELTDLEVDYIIDQVRDFF
jgi:dTDP-4-amino-4,6-dideoxygalactose transaminase